ncbi:MAG: renalase [Planctomycetota bacterium]|jgi:renalase
MSRESNAPLAPMRVGIIGGGVAGLACAGLLAAQGHQPVVFDKGRGPGGRSSSRRAAPFAFDHGAQYFTARDPSFRRALDTWLDKGVVARWEGRIVSLSLADPQPVRGATERFVGTPQMNALAKYLARDIELNCRTVVTRLDRLADGWRVVREDGVELGEFSRLVVALPPAQASALIGKKSPLGDRAAAVGMRPCWAVMLGLSEPYSVSFDGAFCDGHRLSWICRDNSKPGRPTAEAWVLHASPEWTEAHLYDDRGAVTDALIEELERLTGVSLPAVIHRDAHRWGLALSDPHLEPALFHDPERGLALAGDAYHGGRIEGAYLSGEAAARCLI